MEIFELETLQEAIDRALAGGVKPLTAQKLLKRMQKANEIKQAIDEAIAQEDLVKLQSNVALAKESSGRVLVMLLDHLDRAQAAEKVLLVKVAQQKEQERRQAEEARLKAEEAARREKARIEQEKARLEQEKVAGIQKEASKKPSTVSVSPAAPASAKKKGGKDAPQPGPDPSKQSMPEVKTPVAPVQILQKPSSTDTPPQPQSARGKPFMPTMPLPAVAPGLPLPFVPSAPAKAVQDTEAPVPIFWTKEQLQVLISVLLLVFCLSYFESSSRSRVCSRFFTHLFHLAT
eukprot:m.912074 g.912074  ORF g.912074 m.912074 type:complete len:289 (+) comp60113_c0_seq65:1074-1940(+)